VDSDRLMRKQSLRVVPRQAQRNQLELRLREQFAAHILQYLRVVSFIFLKHLIEESVRLSDPNVWIS
jgi:hypothetical protein